MIMAPVTVLNVAEKPSVARSLASVFSRVPGARDQPMRRDVHQIFLHENVSFPPVFQQGRGEMRNGGPVEPHTMITTSVRGHLASQDFADGYGWNKCRHIELFDAPIETYYSPDMQPLEKMLRQQARRAHAVILWLDCDREGEAIAAEVQHVCLESNPRLRVYRAKFSTVLPQEIQRALRSLGTLNEDFVQAVKARTTLDLRVGAAFTRFQTVRLTRKFEIEGVVSYGPCQFPTLGFVVERWARIETFVPEDFWYIQLTLQVPDNGHQNMSHNNSTPNRSLQFTWTRNRLYDRVVTMALYESCLNSGEAVVTDLSGRPKHKWRPVPLATVELQKRASRFLRLGGEQVMTAAENLYQHGYISYPRTETEKFRPEFNHQTLVQDFTNLGEGHEFGTYAGKLLNENGFQSPRAGQHDDNAHPPITPCKAVDPNTINDPVERSVYILVVKHYLACCSRDAVGKETVITVAMSSETFTAKGLMILERNWLEVYAPYERWSTGQGQLPHVEVGSRIIPSSLLLQEGRTTPPRLLSEAELIALMDRNGIGTDATIASHIQTIQDRNYATKNANQEFSPTKLGIALVEGYNSMGYQLNKPDLRREVEHECNLVANGQKTMEDIMEPILLKMKECFERATAEAHKLDAAVARHFAPLGSRQSVVLQANFSECGVCHNRMALKETQAQQRNNNHSNTRKVLYCNTCNVGFTLPKGELRPATVQENDTGPPILCAICQYQALRVTPETGGSGYAVCPKCYNDPPNEHGAQSNVGETFPCFKCQHPTCSLATGTPGGDIEILSCTFCTQGKITLKKTSRGSYALSCSNYSSRQRCSYSIWMPSEASSVSVPDSICHNCTSDRRQVRMLHFVWKPGSVPMHIGRESTVCIFCDSDFRQELNIRLPQANQVATNPRRANPPPSNRNRNNNIGQEGGTRSSRRNGSAQRRAGTMDNGTGNSTNGIVCFRCKQVGHYANSCPQAN
mmetsp:Transcript_20457/g.30371  ORF Transcript_20457/g.30371 Transcript_20457/m.30371 type:complete len:969 (-) Transcript_20457:950-3856(-)